MGHVIHHHRRASSKLISKFSLAERLAIQHANPVKLTAHLLAGGWAAYFLWNHDWRSALIGALTFGALGVAYAWNSDVEKLSKSGLGKWFYVMLSPINLSLSVPAYALFFYGMWLQRMEVIIFALAMLAIANLFGWERLDDL